MCSDVVFCVSASCSHEGADGASLLKFVFSLRLFSTECVTLCVPAESAVCIFVYQPVILLLKLSSDVSALLSASMSTADC